jgi:O-Antigen ligase
VLPLSVVVGGKSLYFSDFLLPIATMVALSHRSKIRKLDLITWVYVAVIALQAAVGLARRQPFDAFTQDLRGPIYLVCGFFIASRLFTHARGRSALTAAGVILWYTAGLMIATIVTGVELLAGRTETVRTYEAGEPAEIDATRFIVNAKGLAFMALVAGTTVLLSRSATTAQRWIAGILVVPAFVVTFLSYARATLLAVIVCALLLVFLRRAIPLDSRRASATGLVVATVIGLVGLSGTGSLISDPEGSRIARQVAGFQGRVLDGLSSETASTPGNTYRLLENRYAVEAAARNPLFGHGIGASYKPRSFGDRSLSTFENNPDFGSRFIHNGWLWYLVKAGAVGLVAFLAFLLTPILVTVRGSRAASKRTTALDIGLAVSIGGLMVINAFEPDLHRVGTAPLAGAVLGYLALRSVGHREPGVH